jgi:hypothetical protein
MSAGGGEKPDWWLANEQIKNAFDLPEYEPPRFSDGTYVHQIVEPLEERYGCEIRFVGVDTHYPDDWEVRIDREPIMAIGRRRTENGNTRYLLESDTFRERVLAELDG